MPSLAEKIRRSRERGVVVSGRTFTIRRPTAVEVQKMAAESSPPSEWVRRCVVGWDLKEIDLIPGGSPEPAPFDVDAWAEWIADQPELWGPLFAEIAADFEQYVKRRGDDAKN